MASAGAQAQKQAQAQAAVNAHFDRIGKAVGVQPPPPVVRAEGAEARALAETERAAAFLGLVADAVDPANAGKKEQLAQSMGGMGEYNEQEELAKAEKAKSGGEGEEPTFRGRALSEFDGIADEELTNEEGIGEATAKEIVKARHKRDRAREKAEGQ